MQSATPVVLLQQVWPFSLSLAATKKIDVSFSSSAYLDVSVQRVSLRIAMDSLYGDCVWHNRVSPFGNLRVVGYLHLSAAYRSLSRPSSAPDAKAFTLRSSSLILFYLGSKLCELHFPFIFDGIPSIIIKENYLLITIISADKTFVLSLRYSVFKVRILCSLQCLFFYVIAK